MLQQNETNTPPSPRPGPGSPGEAPAGNCQRLAPRSAPPQGGHKGPQQAFRAFQISTELQEKHGYPKLTPELRARIFGLNATRPYGVDVDEVLKRARHDAIERRRTEYRDNPDPHFLTFGPKNRREFLANLKARGGLPV